MVKINSPFKFQPACSQLPSLFCILYLWLISPAFISLACLVLGAAWYSEKKKSYCDNFDKYYDIIHHNFHFHWKKLLKSWWYDLCCGLYNPKKENWMHGISTSPKYLFIMPFVTHLNFIKKLLLLELEDFRAVGREPGCKFPVKVFRTV